MSLDKESLAQSSSVCMSKTHRDGVLSILTNLGWSENDLNKVKNALEANPIDSSVIVPELSKMESEAEDALKDAVQSEVNDENSKPTKKSSVNGKESDVIKEPINVKKVSSPVDIPDNNNSYEEEHPDSFGDKDRAGNFTKHNLLTGLFQRGLKNGCLLRSDKNGNTTIYIPANHKVNIGESYNINSGAFDHFMSGEGHFESKSKITIKAPDIEIIGNLRVDGTQINTKTITANGDITSKAQVIGKVDGLFGGKSFIGHKHIGNLGSPTSPPL